MSLWLRVQKLPLESLKQIHALYGEKFPIEVRHYLAAWIEQRVRAAESVEQRVVFVEELRQELQQRTELMTSPDDFVRKMKLEKAAERFLTEYSRSPLELFEYVQSCLDLELQMVSKLDKTHQENMPVHTDVIQINKEPYDRFWLTSGIQIVRQSVIQANALVKIMESHSERYVLLNYDCTKLKVMMPEESSKLSVPYHIRVRDLEVDLQALVTQLSQKQTYLVHLLKTNIAKLKDMSDLLLDVELKRWLRQRQYMGSDFQMSEELNVIQVLCEDLVEVMWLTVLLVKDLIYVSNLAEPTTKTIVLEVLDEMAVQVTKYVTTLVASTFVIEKQPPQVIMPNTSFEVKLRLLTGAKLNTQMSPPLVKAIVMSKEQACKLVKLEDSSELPNESCGDILNSVARLTYQWRRKQHFATFRNLQVMIVNRPQLSLGAVEEKFTLLFRTQLALEVGQHIQVWTRSMPVLLLTKENRAPLAWASVLWDNAFSASELFSSSVPDRVKWKEMADMLKLKFFTATGVHLSEENLLVMSEKVLKLPSGASDVDSVVIRWPQFCKFPLPGRNFSFWEWFYMTVRVTQAYLRGLWAEMDILEFIQKKQVDGCGSFNLRFPDSESDCTIIVCRKDDTEVHYLRPSSQSVGFLVNVFDPEDPQVRDIRVGRSKVFTEFCSQLVNLILEDIDRVKLVHKMTLPQAEQPPETSNSIYTTPVSKEPEIRPDTPAELSWQSRLPLYLNTVMGVVKRRPHLRTTNKPSVFTSDHNAVIEDENQNYLDDEGTVTRDDEIKVAENINVDVSHARLVDVDFREEEDDDIEDSDTMAVFKHTAKPELINLDMLEAKNDMFNLINRSHEGVKPLLFNVTNQFEVNNTLETEEVSDCGLADNGTVQCDPNCEWCWTIQPPTSAME